MATITVKSSTNVQIVGADTTPISITIGNTQANTNVSNGLYRIGDYLVDRKGGNNTYIKQGDIIYGIGSLAPGQYIIAVALQDNPTLITHIDPKYNA